MLSSIQAICFNWEEQHLKHFLDKIQGSNNSIPDITLILIPSQSGWMYSDNVLSHLWGQLSALSQDAWRLLPDSQGTMWVCPRYKLNSLENGDKDMSGSEPLYRSVPIVLHMDTG